MSLSLGLLPIAGFMQPMRPTAYLAGVANCYEEYYLDETAEFSYRVHPIARVFLKFFAPRRKRCATMRGMSKAVKPLSIILLAVVVAVVGAVYLSRRPEEVPETSAAPVLGKGGGHFRGPEKAPITLVEFGDYSCPSCGAYHPVVKELLNRYPKQVRLEFHHYPLISIHPNAMAAALAVEAAGEQGRYWEMHDLIFEHQEEWSASPNPEPQFLALASRIGINSNDFMQAMRSPQLRDRVLQDVVRARDAKVDAVPTFFIDGERIHVTLSVGAFVEIIEARLRK